MKKPLHVLLFSLLIACRLHAEVTETFTQTYPISASGSLSLENVNGPVEIIGWSKNEVQVEAIKTAPDAEDLARIQLLIEATPDRVSIETKHKKKLLFGTWRGAVRYTVHVPAAIRLEEISVINDLIRVRGVSGPVQLKTVNGPIDATGLTGAGRFETVNGGITVAYENLDGIDALSFRTINGRCDLTLPKDEPFSVNSKSVNGGVRTDMPIKVEKSGLTQFRGSLGEGGPKITFNSVNGELVIHAD
jgi:DUF4097 and DUF4098 domain-containing protein YvlB